MSSRCVDPATLGRLSASDFANLLVHLLSMRSPFKPAKQIRGGYFPVDLSSPKASNGCVWSLPPCFIRISTLPSAASSSCRQEFDRRTPSSKSFKDCSSDRSPFSSWSTIFSNCCRQSSNFGKERLQNHCKGKRRHSALSRLR